MNILFITNNQLGDSILTSGVLNHYIKLYPNAKITLCAGEIALPLFSFIPNIIRLIPIRKKKYHLHWLQLYVQVFYINWDIIIDFKCSHIGHFLFKKKYIMVPSKNKYSSKISSYQHAFKLKHPPIPYFKQHILNIKTKDEAHLDPPYIFLSPVSQWKPKNWSIKKYAELMIRLTHSKSLFPYAKIIIAGTELEKPEIMTFFQYANDLHVHLLIGHTIIDVANVLSRASIFIGNDSGLMHLAASLDIPTVGLFGPTNDRVYGPNGAKCIVVRTRESFEKLQALVKQNGDSYPAMQSLGVSDVELAITRSLTLPKSSCD